MLVTSFYPVKYNFVAIYTLCKWLDTLRAQPSFVFLKGLCQVGHMRSRVRSSLICMQLKAGILRRWGSWRGFVFVGHAESFSLLRIYTISGWDFNRTHVFRMFHETISWNIEWNLKKVVTKIVGIFRISSATAQLSENILMLSSY